MTGAQKRKQQREQKEKERREKEELALDIERLRLGPTALWKLVTDHADVFEARVLKSGKLNESDIKFFYECCRASRDAVRRAKIGLQEYFSVAQLSSISTLELAWEGIIWGEKRVYPNGEVFTYDEGYFCEQVANINDLELLRWAREEKKCAWNHYASNMAASNGNLEMLKYCVDNGCDVHPSICKAAAFFGHLDCVVYLRAKKYSCVDVCAAAYTNNHIDVLAYAVKNKLRDYEAYEQFVPK